MIDSDDRERMLIEAALARLGYGEEASLRTPEADAMRERLKKEIANHICLSAQPIEPEELAQIKARLAHRSRKQLGRRGGRPNDLL